jgi:hypothetical protein
MDNEGSFQEIVSEIHHTVTTRQRFEVFQKLFMFLEYNPQTRLCNADPRVLHFLVRAGIVNSLCLQLGFVLHRHGSCKEELDLTCTVIGIFYRYCPELINEDYLRQRQHDLLRFLPEIFLKGIVLPVLSVWHSCSSCPFGTALLLKDRSMLQAVGRVLEQHHSCGEESLIESLGLLKNVTYYGEDFRRRVVEYPGLLTSLTSLPFQDVYGKDQERFSAVIRNLSLSSDTRLLLAQRPDVLTTMARMASSTNRTTLRNILNTLANLAMDADSCLVLVFHGEGVLVELLKRFVGHDDDAVIRKRAARTLKLLARDTSAPLLVHDIQLMECLSYRALHDINKDVRVEAAEAFAKCAALIKAPMAEHDAVLDALTHLAASPNINANVMARALKAQAAHPENRRAMAKRGELMAALAKIAISDGASRSARENACSTFLDLSNDEVNITALATPAILESLVRNSTDRREGHTIIRDSAVRTLLNLAFAQSNRQIMAKQASLLQCLLQFASTTPTDELKKEVKAVILQLAAEL